MAWLTVMEAAHQRLPEELCLELLPRLFSCCVRCLLAHRPVVKTTAVSLMEVRWLNCTEVCGVVSHERVCLLYRGVWRSLEAGVCWRRERQSTSSREVWWMAG